MQFFMLEQLDLPITATSIVDRRIYVDVSDNRPSSRNFNATEQSQRKANHHMY